MFTGIIEELGTVVSMQERDDLLLWNGDRGSGFELVVRVKLALEGAYIGCSIAINGTCLTATTIDGDEIAFGVAPETYVAIPIATATAIAIASAIDRCCFFQALTDVLLDATAGCVAPTWGSSRPATR
ncbi:hypothetical protein PINS_up004825 [Pythium insidiosum]|nr:hypothetical protein PINS_up004825 [Pythium insidiosum]